MHARLDALFRQPPAVEGEEKVVGRGQGRLGAHYVDITSDELLDAPADRDNPLLAALAHDLEEAFLKIDVVQGEV